MTDTAAVWPPLPYAESRETLETLQLYAQIVGKVRLACTPWVNHSWHATLYVSARGLTTSVLHHDGRAFDIEFDFVEGVLAIRTADGGSRTLKLRAEPVSVFYRDVLAALAGVGMPISIDRKPNEVAVAVPFPQDDKPRVYDPNVARNFWQALVQCDRIFKRFRTGFVGKCSPVHFFWGSFDLAVTRFSGRRAPAHPGGVPNLPDGVAREAYSHEVSSAGFWPGSAALPAPAFYAYAYPEPDGFRGAKVRPQAAGFDASLGEFVLRYHDVRAAASPDAALLDFLQSTYEAAADAARWDRPALEIPQGRVGKPRLIPV